MTMMMMLSSSLLLSILFTVACMVTCASGLVSAFYVPTYQQKTYTKSKDSVSVLVNSLRSRREFVPYNFYEFPYCRPDVLIPQQETLGQILFGDDQLNSVLKFPVLKNITCTTVKKANSGKCNGGTTADIVKNIKAVRDKIETRYRGHMSIDNMPGYNPGVYVGNFFDYCKNGPMAKTNDDLWQRGYALGVPAKCLGKTMLNNHLEFEVKYNVPDPQTSKDDVVIVGFTIVPQSIGWAADAPSCDDNFVSPRYNSDKTALGPLYLDDIVDVKSPKPVVWSYSVKWVPSDVKWASRWDAYLSTTFADGNATVHWTYITISLLLSLVVSAMVTFILMRTLHIDCNKINSDDPEERQEEVGWKYIHADVFRQPDNLHYLAIFAGNGVQLTITLMVTLIIGLLGFLVPANRGALVTTALLMFVLASFPAGYCCAMVQKMFDVKEWKTIFFCALIFPGEVFFAWLFSDLMSLAMGASNAVNFGTFFGLLTLWLLISVPLAVLGSSFAWSQDKITFPVPVGKMAREIPLQRWYYSAPFSLVGPGFVPFMIIFLELRFIFNSIWMGYVYYVFGFLAVTLTLWAYTCALTAVVMVYYQLAYEDWRWWWRSVFIPGGCGIWLFAYATYFFFDTLNVKSAPGTILYFTYSFLLSLAYVLVSGTIGFFACLLFTRKIYGSIRIE